MQNGSAGEHLAEAPEGGGSGSAVLHSAVVRARASGHVVGRADELAALADAWAATSPSAPVGLVLVAGEPGAGKTRLAAEQAARVHAAGGDALFGRCDADVPAPFRPWLPVLAALVERADDALLALHADQHGSELARLLGSGAQRLGPPPGAPDPDADVARHRLLSAATGLISASATRRPLAIVLDDLHVADPGSLQLLHALLEGPDAHVLVLATIRDAESDHGPAFRDAVAALGRHPGVRRLPVAGLDLAAVRTLAGAGADADALYADTGGNALFVLEMLRHLNERRDTAQDLPRTITEVIDRRVAQLGDGAARAARYGAALGRTFDFDLLVHVLGEDEDPVLDAIERCCVAALLTEVSDRPGSFQFSHPIVQQALAAQLSEVRRRRLHRRAAEWLAAAGERDAVSTGELALHWASAGGAFVEQAVAAAVEAGEQAQSVLALDDAVRAFARALALHEQAGGDRDDQTTELLLRLGDAERRAGHDQYGEHLLAAAELAHARGDTARLVRAALANSRGIHADFRTTDNRRIAVLEQALDALGAGALNERALLLAALATEHFADRERRLALADEALTLARRGGDERGLAEVLYRRCLTIAEPATVGERLQLTAELTRLAERLDEPIVRLRAAAERARVLFEAGRAEAVQEAERVIALAPRTGSAFARYLATSMQALLLQREGRLDEAEAEALHGAEQGAGVVPDAVAIFGAQILPVRWDQGRLGELADWAAQASAEPGAQLGHRALVPLALIEAGRIEEARRALEAGVADGLPVDANVLFMVGATLWGEACLRLGHAGGAALSLERLLPWREQYVFTGVSLMGSVARLCAGLAALLDRADEARALYVLAETVDERVGAAGPLARTLIDHGRFLGDGARLERGRAIASRHGFPALLAAAGAPAPEPTAGGPMTASLKRDGDVWTLTVAGRVTRLKDAKGLHHIARLLAAPGVELHALDLVGPSETVDRGDAGPALDAQAKATYRARIEDLRETIEEAEAFNDPERLARARDELQWIGRAMSQAVGLGGRDRPQAADAERARVNVTRAIRTVLRHLAEHDEAAARLLEAGLRTGTFCVYRPDPGRPVTWDLAD